jgi:hypothetical protein
MIPDQTIGSARAEKNCVGQFVFGNLITAMLASVLVLASLTNLAMAARAEKGAAVDMRLLPPIPYLDSTPWMKWNAATPTLRIDTLMAPSVTPRGILQTPQDRARARPSFS